MTKLNDLEKRVAKLEKELLNLKATNSEDDSGKTRVKTKKHGKKHKDTVKTKKKRKVNEYFKMMLEAKKANKASFVYKGNTYKGTKHERLGMIYKKA